jgi:hypothetical protein
MAWFVARPARLERATCGFVVRRSIQLSYGRATNFGLRSAVPKYAKFRAATNPILNHVGFRTNHEPYMVHGVVREFWRPELR